MDDGVITLRGQCACSTLWIKRNRCILFQIVRNSFTVKFFRSESFSNCFFKDLSWTNAEKSLGLKLFPRQNIGTSRKALKLNEVKTFLSSLTLMRSQTLSLKIGFIKIINYLSTCSVIKTCGKLIPLTVSFNFLPDNLSFSVS